MPLFEWNKIPEGGTKESLTVYTAIRNAFREVSDKLDQLPSGAKPKPPAPLAPVPVSSGLPTGITYVLSFTVVTLPSAALAGGIIYVSNEVGGATIAFSDGTNWRRVADRAIVA